MFHCSLHSFTQSFNHFCSFILLHSFIHPFTHSIASVHSFSYTHSFINSISCIHSLTPLAPSTLYSHILLHDISLYQPSYRIYHQNELIFNREDYTESTNSILITDSGYSNYRIIFCKYNYRYHFNLVRIVLRTSQSLLCCILIHGN